MPQEWPGQMEGGQGALARGKAVPCRPLCVGCALSYRYQARRGCRWMPGVYAQPRPLQTMVMSTCLSTGRELPLVFREEPGVSRVARVMPCPLVIWIRGTRHLPPAPPPVVTTQVVQEDRPFLPVFSFCPWTQEAR